MGAGSVVDSIILMYNNCSCIEISNLTCDHCKYCGMNCKCIDHNVVHFSRPWFSCDVYTGKHTICSSFDPVSYFKYVIDEWQEVGGFWNWQRLWKEQWHNGRLPQSIALILAKPRQGREFSDDRYYVSYDDFVYCNIMKEDGIHFYDYAHIEKSRKSPIGYIWIHEGPGILKRKELQ